MLQLGCNIRVVLIPLVHENLQDHSAMSTCQEPIVSIILGLTPLEATERDVSDNMTICPTELKTVCLVRN